MKLYVAFRTDVDPPTRTARGSFTILKKEMKEAGEGAEFTVVLYDIKPNLENLCQAIEDVTELDADWTADYYIKQDQLREVK